MSTRATLVARSAGVRRTPAAAIPATRRGGSADSSSSRTPCSISRARVGGSRSEASGSRISETGVIVATSDSNTQRIMVGPRRIRSVSPVLRIRSIRQSSAARHHTRRSLSSPSSWASPTKESLSGTCRAPEVSTYPDHGRSAEAWIAGNQVGRADARVGHRPGLQGHRDTDQRGGRDQHDQPARSHAASVGGPLQPAPPLRGNARARELLPRYAGLQRGYRHRKRRRARMQTPLTLTLRQGSRIDS